MIIFGITNRNLCKDFYEQIDKISKSKLNYLIIREKDLNCEQLSELTANIKNKFKNSNIKLIVNSNVSVAKNIDVDGIQLSFKDFMTINNELNDNDAVSLKTERNKFGFNNNKNRIYKLVGVSIHSYDEGIKAYENGADYVIYGHIFQTNCKKDIEPRGLGEIERLSKKITIPIVGIGGINTANFNTVINAGAEGIAIMSSLMESYEPNKLVDSYLLNY